MALSLWGVHPIHWEAESCGWGTQWPPKPEGATNVAIYGRKYWLNDDGGATLRYLPDLVDGMFLK